MLTDIDEVLENLKHQVDEKKYLDVGKDANKVLGVSKTKLMLAVQQLQEQGYARFYVKLVQAGSNLQTHIKVLALPGTTYKDVHENRDKIQPLS